MDTLIRKTRDEQNVLTLFMDAPAKPVNTCSPEFLDELSAAIDEIEKISPRGVIFASAKPHSFNAGADLFEIRKMTPDQVARFLELGQSLFDRIAHLPMPTVAAINGDCLGGGFELALACQWRVAAEDVSISIGLPEVKLGLIPSWGGANRLPRLIGWRRALPILLAGKTLPPKKALKAGMIDEIVRPEALLSAARRLVHLPSNRRLPLIDRTIASIAPLRRRVLNTARHQTRKQTYGNYPAPLALLDVIELGYEKGFAAGLEAERHAILELTATDAGRNLLRLFFLRQAAKREAMASLHARPAEVKYAAVIGGGTMGAGIAYTLAHAGIFVRLVELDAPATSAALGRIKKMVDDDISAGRVDRLAARQIFNRICPTIDWTGLELADLVIEAVVEKLETKREVFARLDRLTRPSTVLASNTSSLLIADIAQTTLHPQRVVGMHFFNPVPKMPLVEVVRGPQSDDAALATAITVAARIGKTPVLVNDSPGFLVNRILVPYLSEALILASDGVSIRRIDQVMKMWGMPMGPFELLDEIGLDIAAHVLKSLEHAAPPPAYVIATFDLAMQRRWLGKKSGLGFYRHPAGKRRQSSLELNAELAQTLHAGLESETSEEAIQQRLILPMVNEAAKLLEEHVTDSTETIDLATVFGIGLAPFRGGIVQYANSVGIPQVVRPLKALADHFGSRFLPAWSLQQAARDQSPLRAAVPVDRPASRIGSTGGPPVDRVLAIDIHSKGKTHANL